MLDTSFNCLFCAHEKSVTIKIDKKAGVGDLACKVCGVNWQTSTNYLSAPVDVYAEWLEATDAIKNEKAEEEKEDREFSNYGTTRAGAAGDDDDDDYD